MSLVGSINLDRIGRPENICRVIGRWEPDDPQFGGPVRRYLGGRGFTSYAILRRLMAEGPPPSWDHPDNLIAIGAGPLVGTLAPSSSRCTFGLALSPVTNAFSDSNVGGHWAANFRRAGWFGLLLTGRSKEWCYLLVDDDKISVHDLDTAVPYRGTATHTVKELSSRYPGSEVAAIGPAGVTGVSFASVLIGSGRLLGAGGVGAVLGAKRVKAIVVRSSKGLSAADPDRFRRACEKAHRHVLDHPVYEIFSTHGTTVVTDVYEKLRSHPIMNWTPWQRLKDTDYASVMGSEAVHDIVFKNRSCSGCPVHCSHMFRLKDGGDVTEGPEYEAVNSFGAKIGNKDLRAALAMLVFHNELGLDHRGCGNLLSALMHVQQTLKSDGEFTGDLAEWLPEFGNMQSAQQFMLNLIYGDPQEFPEAYFREGYDEGMKRVFGTWVWEKHAISIKGMTLSGLDPRGAYGVALGLGVSTRGGCHQRSLATIEHIGRELLGNDPSMLMDYYGFSRANLDSWAEAVLEHPTYSADDLDFVGAIAAVLDPEVPTFKPYMIRDIVQIYTATDAVGGCRFVYGPWRLGINLDGVANMVGSFLGMEITGYDVQQVGRRIEAVESFIQREFYGMGRRSDCLPDRFYEESLEGKTVDRFAYERMLDLYYHLLGYDGDGVPTPATLHLLGIEEDFNV